MRILGIPVLKVASPALGLAPGGSPDAATRARVIEGNLALLYRPCNLCTPSEWLAERILAVGLMHGQEKTCGDGGLKLRGPPEALWIEAEPQPGGSVLLQGGAPCWSGGCATPGGSSPRPGSGVAGAGWP